MFSLTKSKDSLSRTPLLNSKYISSLYFWHFINRLSLTDYDCGELSFPCSDGSQCIFESYFCDGRKDCGWVGITVSFCALGALNIMRIVISECFVTPLHCVVSLRNSRDRNAIFAQTLRWISSQRNPESQFESSQNICFDSALSFCSDVLIIEMHSVFVIQHSPKFSAIALFLLAI